MFKKDIEDLARTTLDESLFKVIGFSEVNHEPHKFLLSKSDAERMENVIKSNPTADWNKILESIDARCEYPGCTHKYSEHRSSTVLELELSRTLTLKEANEELVKLVSKIPKEAAFDGFSFLTPKDKNFIIV